MEEREIFLVFFCFLFLDFVWKVVVVCNSFKLGGVVWFGTKPGFYRYTVRYYGISVRRPLTLKHQLPLTLLPDCRPNYPTILSLKAFKHNIYIENFGLEARKSRNQVRKLFLQYYSWVHLVAAQVHPKP